MGRTHRLFAGLALLALFAGGCATQPVDEAVAVVSPTSNHERVRGTVRFFETEKGVLVLADVKGLEPNSAHGFHIHEFGDMTRADGTSAGGHYNPLENPHGLPQETAIRHAGDLGNLRADEAGRAQYKRTIKNISIAQNWSALTGPPTGQRSVPVLGRAVVIHAEEDDGSQPTGNAGDRIGYGVIGVAK